MISLSDNAPKRVFLFSYDFRGSRWSLEVPAEGEAEARMRLGKMASAELDGEVKMKVAVPTGPLAYLRKFLGLLAS